MSATGLQIVLAIVGSSGIIGAIVAIVKLRPDMTTAAVSQAQGAAMTMKELNEAQAQEITYWRDRCYRAEQAVESANSVLESLRKKINELEH